MSKENLCIVLFTCFAIGLPFWAMDANKFEKDSVHSCSGDCYAEWQQETGGILAVVATQAEARANASPAELGEKVFAGCIACHGSRGEGGVGPTLAGQTQKVVYSKLMQYKNGETRGPRSTLMWGQASALIDEDMKNIGAFVESLPVQ